jgi:hypothetical protein
VGPGEPELTLADGELPSFAAFGERVAEPSKGFAVGDSIMPVQLLTVMNNIQVMLRNGRTATALIVSMRLPQQSRQD